MKKIKVTPSKANTVKGIIKGFSNLISNTNEDISNSRLDVCRQCPLFKNKGNAHLCNPLRTVRSNVNWLDDKKDTNFIKGCGCVLESKSRLVQSGQTCPAYKWNEVDFYFTSIKRESYEKLLSENKLDQFITNLKTLGIVMAAYINKLHINRKFINHKALLEHGYVVSIKGREKDKEPYVEYTKDNIILKSFIDGTYEYISLDKKILRKESLLTDTSIMLDYVFNKLKLS